MVRLFFALECPGLDVGQLNDDYISEKSSNYHITIAFLGERSDPVLEAQRVSEACVGKLPLEIEYQCLGAFQQPSNARVLWIVVKSQKIKDLASGVRLISESDDRPFLPHVTISRFKQQTNLERLVLDHKKSKFGSGIVDKLILFKSELTRKGAVHTPLHFIDGNGSISSK